MAYFNLFKVVPLGVLAIGLTTSIASTSCTFEESELGRNDGTSNISDPETGGSMDTGSGVNDGETGGGCELQCLDNQRLLSLEPVAYYRLNETALNTSIFDSSGNNFTGFLNPDGDRVDWDQPNEAHCSEDGAMRFHGNFQSSSNATHEGAYVETSTALLPKTSRELSVFSISLWYKFDTEHTATSVGAVRSRVFSIGEKNSDQIGYYHDGVQTLSPHSWSMRENDGSGDHKILQYPSPPSSDTWHHAVFTTDGNVMRAYLDGEERISDSPWEWNGPTWDNTTATIASNGREYSTKYNGRFNGWVDEVAVFDKAISADDVARIYSEATELLCPKE